MHYWCTYDFRKKWWEKEGERAERGEREKNKEEKKRRRDPSARTKGKRESI